LPAGRIAVKSSHRLLVPLGVVVLLAVALCVCRDRPWERPEPPPAGEQAPSADALEERRQAVLRRYREQERLVRELATGRRTLLEAAAGFRAVSLGDVSLERGLDETYPAGTEEERLCRWVIAYLRTALGDEPGTAGLATRLEEELRHHVRQGTLRLPGS
jgi:hypothetical protein